MYCIPNWSHILIYGESDYIIQNNTFISKGLNLPSGTNIENFIYDDDGVYNYGHILTRRTGITTRYKNVLE